jgi:hypothetical protein
MLNEPLNSSLKSTLLSSFHFRNTQITTNSKSMTAFMEILSLVPWSESFKYNIGFICGIQRKPIIEFAAVDEQWLLALEVFLGRCLLAVRRERDKVCMTYIEILWNLQE